MSSKKKILVVAESIDVEDSSGTKGRVALIKNLNKIGHEVVVYHYTRKDLILPGISCIAIKEKKRNILFLLSRIERHLRYRLGLDLHSQLENLFGFSFTLYNDRNSIVEQLRKIKNFDPDLVFTLSKGGSFRPHHALLKIPEWHTKWVAYIHDPYPMHCYPRPYDYVEPGHQQKRKFFLRVALKAQYAAYPSKLLAEWMESYFPPLKGKAIIIPHQINDSGTIDKNTPKFFNPEKFNIVHAGALMSARNPLSLIRAFKNVLEEIPEMKHNSQLSFLGNAFKYAELFSEMEQDFPQLYFSDGYLPFETALKIQKEASVNVILEAKGPISPFLPGKFAHCVTARKPILLLGPFYSESRRLLGDNYPYWSEIEDEKAIKSHIKNLYFKWKGDSLMECCHFDHLQSYLSEENLREVFNNL